MILALLQSHVYHLNLFQSHLCNQLIFRMSIWLDWLHLMVMKENGIDLLIEKVPRPHNSGHYTFESCATSQFEQIIRAVTNLPLGSTKLISPSVMVNLLGEEGFEGEPFIEGIHDALEIPELSFHFYGKKETKPFRKMGHITVLDANLDVALKKALKAKDILKIKGSKKI